ncbi:MAG: hypothetical protein L0Z53_01935 [Acidobacteriales bacterium]|nr:hypothetical protein [Terriglobales bacterium]
MNLRWLWFDYIDSEIDLTPQQRQEVKRRAMERCQTARPTASMQRWIIGFVLFMGAIQLLGAPLFVLLPLTVGAVGVVFVGVAYTWRGLYAPATWSALREIGFDVCPSCGYWLRGLSHDVEECPECGAPRLIPPN